MKKQFYFLVLIAICAISCTSSNSQSKSQVQLDKVMHEFTESTNKNLPLQIDEVTTAQCVTFIGHTLSYKYIVTNEALEYTDTALFKSTMIKNFGNAQVSKAIKYYIDNNIFIVYNIFDTNGALHYSVKITPSDLKNI